MHTKLFYATLTSILLFISTANSIQQAPTNQTPDEEIRAEFVACIKDPNDKRTYIQFIDSVIEKVKQYRAYLDEYFKKYYPKLSVDGFLASLEKAREAKSPIAAGTALYSHSQLLPKEITYPALLMGMTRRMRQG